VSAILGFSAEGTKLTVSTPSLLFSYRCMHDQSFCFQFILILFIKCRKLKPSNLFNQCNLMTILLSAYIQKITYLYIPFFYGHMILYSC
jgi:hypothetical protein